MIHFKVDLRDSRDIHNFQAAQVAMVHYLPQKNHSHPWVVLGKNSNVAWISFMCNANGTFST